MSAQIVIAIDAQVWGASSASAQGAVLAIIGASGGGETIVPAIWTGNDGSSWMVSSYWREHVTTLTDEQIPALQAAARAALQTTQLHVLLTDNASAALASIGVHPPEIHL